MVIEFGAVGRSLKKGFLLLVEDRRAPVAQQFGGSGVGLLTTEYSRLIPEIQNTQLDADPAFR